MDGYEVKSITRKKIKQPEMEQFCVDKKYMSTHFTHTIQIEIQEVWNI
jgi:hypothetical protein